MTAATIEIGGNMLALGMSALTLGTLWVNTVAARRARSAAEEAAEATEVHAVDITHSLERLEVGQGTILARLDDHENRLSRIEGSP